MESHKTRRNPENPENPALRNNPNCTGSLFCHLEKDGVRTKPPLSELAPLVELHTAHRNDYSAGGKHNRDLRRAGG